MLMEDRVAVVVGSGAGIGREIALRMGTEGADVVLAGRSTAEMQEVAGLLRAVGRRALVVPVDLTEPSSVTAAAERATAEFGRVDALVVNSGVAGPTKPLIEVGLDEWDETFAVNVTGTFLCAKAFLPAMLEAGSGSVVVIGSMTGKRPLLHRSPYAASKMALVGLVRTLAAEVGPSGVRVNLVSPGGVEGPRLDRVIAGQAQAQGISEEQARAQFAEGSPLRRLVTAGDVADTTVFLSSSRATAITGQDVNVTAGSVMY
ncbi:NAD(P)-dependent dehydrogenase (short-subunit alcohol dehydrogenase family) [Pseudonocardia sediminis]|uniref:NAD(P)-dependent dehydrogenase (Short-subunit alcohol dehydrogenase family) n=1 Tax=Pseudonocardia sediminis TaxID=1397368 RepID=A0A4Q7UX85_PSEST|nr:SDR family oxidoreductase [Pseudonocardia sediminis]RZT86667.1 NAD(P)-dependent dehydrogenase (short-subunit alcohol dehydrogenase family) [Pseudonocardia sediminis]